MEIAVMGPLTARGARGAAALGTRKQQVVLALLAVHRGRALTMAELVDEVWPDAPPASAVPNLRSYLAGLRRALAERWSRARNSWSGGARG